MWPLWLSLEAWGSFTAEGMRTFPRGSPYLVTNHRCSRDGCSVCSLCETDNTVYGLQPWSCSCEPCIPIKADNLPRPFLQTPLDREECCEEQVGVEKRCRWKPDSQELLMFLGIYFCYLRERVILLIRPKDWKWDKWLVRSDEKSSNLKEGKKNHINCLKFLSFTALTSYTCLS